MNLVPAEEMCSELIVVWTKAGESTASAMPGLGRMPCYGGPNPCLIWTLCMQRTHELAIVMLRLCKDMTIDHWSDGNTIATAWRTEQQHDSNMHL